MKKAILFDLDGTLWNSMPQIVESFNRALARRPELKRQIDITELQGWMGMDKFRLAAAMLPDRSPEERVAVLDECFAEELVWLRQSHGQPYPHLAETLEVLSRDYFLAIVSNCQKGYIETFLDTIGVGEYICDHECFEATGRPKGENIRLVLERNGVERAIYLGDTQGDQDAADLAGVPFVWAAYGFGSINRAAPSISALNELPTLAKELLN